MKIELAPIKILAFLMAVLTFSMPFGTLAQQNSVQTEAATAAIADASKDVNKPLWFGAGCLLSGLAFLPDPYGYFLPPAGLLGCYFYRPDPPPLQLIGKSPEYIDAYTSTYKSKIGNIQAKWAAAGCLSGCVVVGALLVGIGLGLTAAQE